MSWGSRFLPTDITDPATGEPLYMWAKVRPRWYWTACKLQRFLGIVWREDWGGRMSIWTAWAVAGSVYDDSITS